MEEGEKKKVNEMKKKKGRKKRVKDQKGSAIVPFISVGQTSSSTS